MAKRVERASVPYLVGQHVVVGIDEEPVFGQIEMFVCMQCSDAWFVVVRMMKTLNFESHYHSYSVDYVWPKKFTVLAFDDLVDHRAVCCYKR